MKKDQNRHPKSLLKQAKDGDLRALSQLLTAVEQDLRKAVPIISKENSNALKVGITGPPGAGKSTLVGKLIDHYTAQNLKVAVLAVDPSSPVSGGAVLGDRVRMDARPKSAGVFIRSIGSRGALGGVSAATGSMSRVLEICGFQVILIETAGVGQTELEVSHLVDATALLLVPESGDFVQVLKAGILEIADTIVVNKADRPGADLLAQEIGQMIEQEKRNPPRQLFLTTASENKGVQILADALLERAKRNQANPQFVERQNKGQLRALLLREFDTALGMWISKQKIKDPFLSYGKTKKVRL